LDALLAAGVARKCAKKRAVRGAIDVRAWRATRLTDRLPDNREVQVPIHSSLMVSALECGHVGRKSNCRFGTLFPMAAHQHSLFRSALRRAGADVVEAPFVHGVAASVFLGDAALLCRLARVDCAFMARTQGRSLGLARATLFERLGFAVVAESTPPWRGRDVAAWPNGRGLFLGCGFGSEPKAARWLERHTMVEVVPLELRDRGLPHLDLALSVLGPSSVVACRDAFTETSWRVLESLVGADTIYTVPRAEAVRFAINLLTVGKTVCGSFSGRLEIYLRAQGYFPEWVQLDQFHRAGGGARSLVARVADLSGDVQLQFAGYSAHHSG
jgi:N-dimethylarginine dimethylaminohydrolase